MRGTLASGLFAALMLAAVAAHAQEKSAADYKRTGNEKMDASDFVGALDDYQAALKLAPDDATLYFNIGRAEGLLGRNVEALASLEEFGKRATPEVRARAQFDQLYAQTRARVALLTVTCATKGAHVVVGQKVVGDAPFDKLPIDYSDAPVRVRIEADGFREDAQTVALPGARETRITCRLLRKDTSGVLVVNAEPQDATVSVDGREVGNSRPIEVPLQAGAHSVQARHAGFDDASVSVVLGAGDTKRVDVTLAKSAPLTSKWWFWTGIGVVVVGGIVVTAALLTERPADSGTIKPGQLAAPLLRF